MSAEEESKVYSAKFSNISDAQVERLASALDTCQANNSADPRLTLGKGGGKALLIMSVPGHAGRANEMIARNFKGMVEGILKTAGFSPDELSIDYEIPSLSPQESARRI